MKKISTSYLRISETRALINEGYKYSVDCDYSVNDVRTDPWSGMPCVDNKIAVFKDKDEAEAFAATQKWPFNSRVHASVETLKWGETDAEMYARLERERVERKAKKDAADTKKAEAAGMTLTEYRAAKTKNAAERKLKKEIAALEKELAEKYAELAKLTK